MPTIENISLNKLRISPAQCLQDPGQVRNGGIEGIHRASRPAAAAARHEIYAASIWMTSPKGAERVSVDAHRTG